MASRDDIKFLSNPKIGNQRKKYCRFKKFGIKYIDYKDPDFLTEIVLILLLLQMPTSAAHLCASVASFRSFRYF